jgi:hypothetical protein
MQKTVLAKAILGLLLVGSIQLTSCKSKSKTGTESTESTPSTTDTATAAPQPAPVEISTDDALKTGVRDATKDFPDVTATVENGEITLTGTITRDKLPTLMASLNSLQPKKINNNLTIK